MNILERTSNKIWLPEKNWCICIFLKNTETKIKKWAYLCGVGESNGPLSGPFLFGSPCRRPTGDVLGPGSSSNLDRTSVGKPCDWPRGISQTVIPSTVLEPNAEANKICSSYDWETSRAQLPHLPPAFAFFCQDNAQRGKGRGEGWSDSITVFSVSSFYLHLEKLRFLTHSVFT